jgi:hypothetical protein
MPIRRLATATFVVLFLAWQVAVPVLGLFGPRPGRFGWQMYASFPAPPRAWLVRANGSEDLVDLGSLFAVERAEIDYARALRTGLCDATDATAIRVEQPDGEVTVTCG